MEFVSVPVPAVAHGEADFVLNAVNVNVHM